MNQILMHEFEELEGLTDEIEDLSLFEDANDNSDDFKPVQASSLMSADIYYEMEKRNLKTTGFPDTDREILQRAFDEEFKADLEEAKARRREGRRRAAQQAGLQKRRMLMEKTLQEEQDALSCNHQLGMMIDLIKEDKVDTSMRIDVNSVSARSLAKAMWSNTNITCLDLSSNDLNDHAGSYLARILKRNNTLKKVELDNNNLGPKSCIAFGESLQTNKTLVYLSLDSNPICKGDDTAGMRAITDALKVNRTLTSLNFWRAGIDSVSGGVLANGIEENSTLLFCDIGHNNIDQSNIKRITDKLDANMAAYEASERVRRTNVLTLAEKTAQEDAITLVDYYLYS
jgi:hypothetical protein